MLPRASFSVPVLVQFLTHPPVSVHVSTCVQPSPLGKQSMAADAKVGAAPGFNPDRDIRDDDNPDGDIRTIRSTSHPNKEIVAGMPQIVEKPRQQVHYLRMTISGKAGIVFRSSDAGVAVYPTREQNLARTIMPYDVVGMTSEMMDDAANVPTHGISNAVISSVEGLTPEQLRSIVWFGETAGGQGHDATTGDEENPEKGFAIFISGLGTLLNNNPSCSFPPFTKFMISSFPKVKTRKGDDTKYGYMPCFREGKQISALKPMVVPVHPNPMERIRRLHGHEYRPYLYGFIRDDFTDYKNYDPSKAYELLVRAAIQPHEKAYIPLEECDALYLYFALSLLTPAVAPALASVDMAGDAKGDAAFNTERKALVEDAEKVLLKASSGTKSMTECLTIIQNIMKRSKTFVGRYHANILFAPRDRDATSTVERFARNYTIVDVTTMEQAKIRCKEEITKHVNKSVFGTTLAHSSPGGPLRYFRR